MKQLLAFGGGSSFPGTPVSGVYVAPDNAAFLAACELVASVPYSIVVDVSALGVLWYSQGDGTFVLVGGSVADSAGLPTLGTVGGVTFVAYTSAALYNEDLGIFQSWSGTAWTDWQQVV